MADRIGTEIAGFRIESLIARGGMGELYLATQSFPERKVALKLLPQDLAKDPAFRERFVRESHAAASLEHPNIVPVYGAGEFEGELWISMRYVEGEDLRGLLDRQGALHSERAAGICAQVADALQEAHEHGLVHRDVKPSNILISRGDRAYLTDFGLIRRTNLETDLTKTGQFMGTVDYVAPEQIRGGDVDGRADVYSLGCVLHECLMGEPPFHRDTEVATLFAHLEDPPPKPSAKRPELPAAFDYIVAKSMAS
jgi:serine/threonine-protein kinase